MQAEVVAGLRAVGDAPGRGEAERPLDPAVKEYRAKAPRPAEGPEADVPEPLSVFSSPTGHRGRSRTRAMRERLDEAIRRRTRVAGPFPDEASALRPVGAASMEISEDGETGRKSLTTGPG